MAGFFSASVRAPITGIILIMEMTASFKHLVPLAIVAVFSYVVAELCHSKPIYDSLLQKALAKDKANAQTMTTLAPAKIPCSRPQGSMVPKAVVAGIKALGSISRNIAMSLRVCCKVPEFLSRKGVS